MSVISLEPRVRPECGRLMQINMHASWNGDPTDLDRSNIYYITEPIVAEYTRI